VIGAYYDFKNDFGKGHGKILLINVNGETDKIKIKNSPVLEGLKI